MRGRKEKNNSVFAMETALSFNDVTTLRRMGNCFQVYSALGMDNGISGGKTSNICDTYLEKNFCRI